MILRSRIGFGRRPVAVGVVALAALAAAASSAASSSAASSSAASSGGTLVVDKSFDLKTADPQRQFEPTGGIVDKALYDTLLQYKGADVAHPLPDVATKYTVSNDAKKYVFTLRKDIKFSDGTPLTSADVVFSFDRLINLKGNPSFLLAGVTVKADGKYKVVLTSSSPNPAIPAIVANTSLGIVNSKLVIAHGGSDAKNASKTDKAEAFLNTTSAGSGPYTLKSYNVTSQVVLQANPTYWGPKPKFSTVIIRNVPAPAQLLDVQRGTNEIALDLSPSQSQHLSGVNVEKTPSAEVFFLFANQNPKISTVTSNPHIVKAIRLAMNYPAYAKLAGPGAIHATGIIPSMFLGSLKSSPVKQNIAKAKAQVKASGISDPTVKMEYPSDITLNGLSFGVLAQKIQADLQKVGITVTLDGSPVASSLNTYRNGTEQLGLWYWGPDYPDPNDYLVFTPGDTVGLRAGWSHGPAPLTKLAKQAAVATKTSQRQSLFTKIGEDLDANSPFYPLIQPGQVVAASKNLTNTPFNVLYWLDVAAVGEK